MQMKSPASSHLPAERKPVAHAGENSAQTCRHDQRLGDGPGAVYRYQVDAVFPLSDHADYDDLIRYVDLVRPKRVLTLHGFAAEFARDLREKIGVEAWALSEENQLELTLGRFARQGGRARLPPSRMAILSTLAAQPERRPPNRQSIRSFEPSRRLAKRSLRHRRSWKRFGCSPIICARSIPEQLPIATIYFTGKAFAQSDLRTVQVGGSIIYRAIMSAAKLSEAEFRRIAHSHGDAGKTAFEALDGRTQSESFTILQSKEFFEQLQKARGPIAKTELLQKRLSILSAREGQYVVKILTGDLRIGLREGLVEEAIAKAFDAPLDDVKEANMLLGDIGATALLASRSELHRAELSIFRPIKCMLASPEPTAEAIWARFVKMRNRLCGR